MKKNISISEEELHEIEKFLSGELQGQSLSDFENRLVADAEWNEKVQTVKLTLLGIKEATLSAGLRKNQSQKNDAVVRNVSSGRRNFFLIISGVAASLLFVALLWVAGVFDSHNQKLFSKYYFPDAGLITSMGVADNYDFDVAMIDYKSGNYKAAIAKWTGMLKGNEGNDTLNYFLGSSYLALDKTEKAITCFEEVIKNQNSVFLYDAHWYLGLAFLKEGRVEDAVGQIKLSNNTQKEELLKKLEHE